MIQSGISHPRRSRARRRAAVSLLAMTLLLAAACSKGGGGSDNPAAGGADLKGSPIVLGAMVNVSGVTGASEATAADVLKAWAAHTNENGGIGGHPVKLEVKDTKGDAATATAAAQALIADTSVVGVIHVSSPTEGAVGQLFAKSDLPVVGGVGYNPQIWSALPNWYGITTTFPTVVTAQFAAAKSVDATTLVALACAEDPSCAAVEPLLKPSAAAVGINYGGLIKVSASAPNYTAECLQIKKDGDDFAQLGVAEATGGRLAADCMRQGYKGWFGATAGSVSPGLYNAVQGLKLAGGLNAFPWFLDTAPVKSFRDVMQQQGVKEDHYGNPDATGTWASAELFRTALSGVTEQDSVDRKTVTSAYGAVKDQDLGGLLPRPITFAAGQPAPKVPCYWVYSFEGGKFTAPSEKATCTAATG